MDDREILRATDEYWNEAADARKTRLEKNRFNWSIYHGLVDWSYKGEGQSTEHLPKVNIALESMTALVKGGLITMGDWFDVTVPMGSPLDAQDIKNYMNCRLEKLPTEAKNKFTHFATIISDAVKTAALESLMTFKVHGQTIKRRNFTLEEGQELISDGEPQSVIEGELKAEEIEHWRGRIDLLPFEDYYIDPKGDGLYEIHEVERDVSQVIERAEAGIYNESAVLNLMEDMERREEEKRKEWQKNQDITTKPSFRKRAVIRECWGNLLDRKGRIEHENVMWAVANERFLIRNPEPNPFWHQESPFVSTPIIRVPFSTQHQGLYDNSSALNLALDEAFNLMLDGALSAVHGVKQLRTDYVENPEEIRGGIPQGATIKVKQDLPQGVKVLENVTEGQLPADIITMFKVLDREFEQASLTDSIGLGDLPSREVKATEVVASENVKNRTFDNIIQNIENECISNVLRKFWMNELQHADDIHEPDVIASIGVSAANKFFGLGPEGRFVLFANQCGFRVHGLSTVLNKSRDFQKVMALMQAAGSNPLLLNAFVKKYSPERVLDIIVSAVNLNPKRLERTEAEQQGVPKEIEQITFLAQMLNANRGGNSGINIPAETVGGPEVPAEINQLTNTPNAGPSNQ